MSRRNLFSFFALTDMQKSLTLLDSATPICPYGLRVILEIKKNMGHLYRQGTLKYSDSFLSQFHSVHHKSHTR